MVWQDTTIPFIKDQRIILPSFQANFLYSHTIFFVQIYSNTWFSFGPPKCFTISITTAYGQQHGCKRLFPKVKISFDKKRSWPLITGALFRPQVYADAMVLLLHWHFIKAKVFFCWPLPTRCAHQVMYNKGRQGLKTNYIE